MAAQSSKSESVRYTGLVKVRAAPALTEAIDRAAAQNFITPSEYVRQKLVSALRADGVKLAGAA